MSQSTCDISTLATINVMIDNFRNTHEEFDYVDVDIPVGYDGYSIILHLPDGRDVSIDQEDITNLIHNGARLYYQQ